MSNKCSFPAQAARRKHKGCTLWLICFVSRGARGVRVGRSGLSPALRHLDSHCWEPLSCRGDLWFHSMMLCFLEVNFLFIILGKKIGINEWNCRIRLTLIVTNNFD